MPSGAGKPSQWYIHPDPTLRGAENIVSVTSEAGPYPGAVVPDATNLGQLVPVVSGALSAAAVDIDIRVHEAGGIGVAEYLWREVGATDWKGVDDVRRFWGYHSPLSTAPGSDNCAMAYSTAYHRLVCFHGTSSSTTGLIKYRDIDADRYDEWTSYAPGLTLDTALAAGDHNARMIDLPDGRLMLVVRVGTAAPYDFDVYHSEDGGLTWQRISRAIVDRFCLGTGPTHNLDSQFQLARAGEFIRLVWVNAAATVITLVSSDRGASWAKLTNGDTAFNTTDADDTYIVNLTGVSESGEFLLALVTAATTVKHYYAVGDNDWTNDASGDVTSVQNAKQIVFIQTPEYVYEFIYWSDEAAGVNDGWTVRRARPAQYLDFTNASGIGWEEIQIANTYDCGIAYMPGRLSTCWAGNQIAFMGARRSEGGGTDIDRASGWYQGGWTTRSIYRAAPSKSLDDLTLPFQSRVWTCECDEPSVPAGSPWVKTVVAGGLATATMDYVLLASVAAGDVVRYSRTIAPGAGPAWGQNFGCCFGWVARIDTGDSGVAADQVAVRIQSENQANTTQLDVSIRMGGTVVIYDNIAAATLASVAVSMRTGSAGQFFECRLYMVQNAGPVYNAQLAVFDYETKVWTVSAVVALTSAAAAGNNVVSWGHWVGSHANMTSWWREFWVCEGATQSFTAYQEGFTNPGSMIGANTSPLPAYLTQGASLAWGGLGGAREDEYTGEVLHTYAIENIAVDSPRIEWRSTSMAAQTIILDAGANNRWKPTAAAAFRTNDRQILVDFDTDVAFGSPTAAVTLDATAFGTATLPLEVASRSGTTCTIVVAAGSAGARLVAGELAGCYIRPTDGAAAGLTWKVTRHTGITLYCDEEAATLQAQGLGVGDHMVVFMDHAAVEITMPTEQYMRLRLTETDVAEGYHRIGTLVVGRKTTIDVPLDWAFTDNMQPNITQNRTRGGIAWAYEEAPPQRTVQGRVIGDAERWREQVMFLQRQAGFEAKPTAWVLDGDRKVESCLLARLTSGAQLDQVGWRFDTWDLLRTMGDMTLVLVEEV